MRTETNNYSTTPKNYRRNTALGIYVILTTALISGYTLIQLMTVV